MVGFQNAPTSPYIYTGLQPNHKYYFAITGVNATGEGETGAGVFAYTIPEVTGFSAGNPQDTTVDLTWDAPDISVINNIQWEITSTPTTTTQTASALNSFPIPYIFTGLTPDTEYTFTITPQVGPDSLAGDPVTSDPISTLPDPQYLITNFTAVPAYGGSVASLSWTLPPIIPDYIHLSTDQGLPEPDYSGTQTSSLEYVGEPYLLPGSVVTFTLTPYFSGVPGPAVNSNPMTTG
jgi:hypothetical protein